jgi:hypothetical protein
LILIEEDGDLVFGNWSLVFGYWSLGFGNWALGFGNYKEEYPIGANWQKMGFHGPLISMHWDG